MGKKKTALGKKKIAFSLGGLAGNNAHGAGFLQAALDNHVEPDMIACTSGQIYWVYQYLKVKADGGNLEAVLEEELKKTATTKNKDLDWQILSCFGKENVFRPAFVEFMTDLNRNMMEAMLRITEKPGNIPLQEIIWSTIPARTLVPMFPDEFFRNISDAFNNAKIGILFNSYNPVAGLEYVHMNEVAKNAMDKEYNKADTYRAQTEYKPITSDFVRYGLWIYQYGFDKNPEMFDGAYFRQIMLSELTMADHIYVARPVNKKWIGPLPTSFIGVEDLKTETSFNGAYAGERDKIFLINKLVEKGDLGGDKYHKISLEEIEVKTQEGFFDYLFENRELFDLAREEADKRFRKL